MSTTEKQFGPGQVPTPGKSAAEQRAEYVQALQNERAGYATRGLKDRVKEVDAELERFAAKPKDRTSPGTDAPTTAAAQANPTAPAAGAPPAAKKTAAKKTAAKKPAAAPPKA